MIFSIFKNQSEKSDPPPPPAIAATTAAPPFPLALAP